MRGSSGNIFFAFIVNAAKELERRIGRRDSSGRRFCTQQQSGRMRRGEVGIAAFLAVSGLGPELNLRKGAKLELVLDRPQHVNQ